MVLSAGCSATVDNFTFCVCDPGEGIIITTPFYGKKDRDRSLCCLCSIHVRLKKNRCRPFSAYGFNSCACFFPPVVAIGGFNTDIMVKSKAEVVVCDLGDCSPFDISHVDLMQNVLYKAESEGIKVKAVVLSNPHNPLGR